uniref:Uncharacterized protein n=1 Tax=Cyanothece sp. (strain PCC 7425 / ATCC 29141) TaxID=395961 RepID=B8HJZ4_CYAP4
MNGIKQKTEWHRLGQIDPQLLTAARLQLHYGIQFMAAVGAALAEPLPDDSHVSLEWHLELEKFVGLPIRAEVPFRVALDPINLISLLLNQQEEAIAVLPLDQQTLATGLDWHKAEIARLGADPTSIKLLTYPPDFPDHPIAHGAPFEVSPQAREREELSRYYANTQHLLAEMVAETEDALPIRIWPHHFDIATLIMLPAQRDGEPMTIGMGLSPGDQSYDQPYWYVSPYPYPEVQQLPHLDGQGFWHTQGWVGAVLKASQLASNPEAQAEQVKAFLQSAWQSAETLLLMPI